MNNDIRKNGRKLLFVTPVLTYSGTPRSTLRMCKVALQLGYDISVWSSVEGPFISEYIECGINVKIITPDMLNSREVKSLIRQYDMGVCNSILTDEYARIFQRYIPTVWYIREATNIQEFVEHNERRLFTLKHFNNLICVSEYAASAISKYTSKRIRIINNCVEDESDLISFLNIHQIEKDKDKVSFIQIGTIDPRKGCDILIKAFTSLPEETRNKAELFLAGGIIKQSSEYAKEILKEIDEENDIHYLGVIKGEDKIKYISEMDVVVLASRDDAGALVVLEGAMFSKPLIVTENVGTKYIVHKENGYVVPAEDVHALCHAIRDMIESRTYLKGMGQTSRYYYETMASMSIYTEYMKEFYKLSERKKTIGFSIKRIFAYFITSEKIRRIIHKMRNER